MTDDSEAGRPEALDFESDRGASRSKWLAAALTLLLAAWFGIGFFLPASESGEPTQAGVGAEPVTVAVRDSTAEPVQKVFVAEGQAQPDRETTMRAGISGEIAEVPIEKGAEVAEDELIARFELAQREADLTRAREALDQAEREFSNAQTLLDRGVGTQDRVTEARSARAAAEADLAAAEQAIEDTEIRAPFPGRVESLAVDPGEFVSAGAEVARITDTAPLTVSIQVPQQMIQSIEAGQSAEVSFITGATRTGEVTFVGRSADTGTRTFAVEVRVPNADGTIPAGVSAETRIPTGEASGHFVSPAILSLDTDGTLGVKTVSEDGVVRFHSVEIVRAQTDGIWVSGLPARARIITVGQGFVNAGDAVRTRPADEVEAELAANRIPATGPSE